MVKEYYSVWESPLVFTVSTGAAFAQFLSCSFVKVSLKPPVWLFSLWIMYLFSRVYHAIVSTESPNQVNWNIIIGLISWHQILQDLLDHNQTEKTGKIKRAEVEFNL